MRRSDPPGPTAGAPESSDTRGGRLLESAAALERELWLLVVCAMLADVALTVHGRQVGLVERNPIARHALGALGVPGLYGLKAVALGLGGLCRLAVDDRYGPVVPLGLALPSLAAVCLNAALVAIVQF